MTDTNCPNCTDTECFEHETRVADDVETTGVAANTWQSAARRLAAENARLRETQTQNERGEWVPAIPVPLFLAFGRVRCDCGQKFRNRLRYREHFAYAHILGLA